MLPSGCLNNGKMYVSCVKCRQKYNNYYCRVIHRGLGCTHVFDEKSYTPQR